MRKTSLFISAAISGLTLLATASNAKADMIKIISKPACNIGSVVQGDVGHVVIAFYDSNGNTTTKAVWPSGIKHNDPKDLEMARGEGCRLSTRTAYVSSARREWAENRAATAEDTTCNSYSYVFKRLFGADTCTCVNFATRVWKAVTNERETWTGLLTPADVSRKIQTVNGSKRSGKFNGGKIWDL
jgi:hypothetical protein